MKKILLITGSFGNGHLQVSNSLKSEFNKKYSDEVVVVESDLFLEAHPNLTPILKDLYLYSFSFFRDIYGYMYYAGKRQKNMSFYRYFSYSYLRKLVEDEKPDIIVSTFPTPALSLLGNMNVPIINIVTDYYYHKSWLTKNAYRYYVSTVKSKEAFVRVGVNPDNIKVFGIPINSSFDEKVDKEDWYKINSLLLNKRTILISAGAFGVTKNLARLIEKITENRDVQVVIICGKNKQLKLNLEALYKERDNVKIIGYTQNMREWMQTSDILITKAGGVTISEALASRIPMILLKPVPGQEGENAQYFEQNGLAKIAYNTTDILNHIDNLLEGNNLDLIKINMNKNYIPNSTENICRDIVKLLS